MNLSEVAKTIFKPPQDAIFNIQTKAPGAPGTLPFTADFLRDSPCGHVFGWMENVGQGWDPNDFGKKQFLILSTSGGLRDSDGTPVALTYSTGQYEPAVLVAEAARWLKTLGAIPFVSYLTEHCDGRMQSNAGMMDSLAFRNDAAIVMRRLIRCLPTRSGVLGIATCDKGLPAMMMALVAMKDTPSVLVPGGVMLLICDGPMGSGMEEVYEITASLKHTEGGKHIALVTDARFSGVSTGACIGQVGPEALAGGPIGKVLDGDIIDIAVDRNNLVGSAQDPPESLSPERGDQLLAKRSPRPDLSPLPNLPEDTRLWAALQKVSGGTWAGCIYDVDTILRTLEAGAKALESDNATQ